MPAVLKPLREAPLAVKLLILSFFFPLGMAIELGGVLLPIYRLVILVFLGPALALLITGPRIRIRSFDLLFLLYNLWTFGVFLMHLGVGPGVQFAGSLVLESFGGYIIARAYVRDERTFKATVGCLLLAVTALGLLALPEAVFRVHFLHDYLAGHGEGAIAQSDYVRLGLLRASVSFEHPILYASFCASILALVWYTETRRTRRWVGSGIIFGATFLGLSSAPLNALGMQAGLAVVNRLTRGIPHRVKIAAGALLALYVVACLVSNQSPIALLAMKISFDSWTAYHRVLIWTYGLDNVMANAMFGLGLKDWARPGWMHSTSVDAFWLLIPMRAGIPAIMLVVFAIWAIMASVHTRVRRRRREPAMQRAAIGWTISVVAMILLGLTVHYWNGVHAYLFFLLGLGGCFADPVRRRAAARPQVPVESRPAAPMRLPVRPAYAASRGEPRFQY